MSGGGESLRYEAQVAGAGSLDKLRSVENLGRWRVGISREGRYVAVGVVVGCWLV